MGKLLYQHVKLPTGASTKRTTYSNYVIYFHSMLASILASTLASTLALIQIIPSSFWLLCKELNISRWTPFVKWCRALVSKQIRMFPYFRKDVVDSNRFFFVYFWVWIVWEINQVQKCDQLCYCFFSNKSQLLVNSFTLFCR